jgi:predicted nucleotidyltransferase
MSSGFPSEHARFLCQLVDAWPEVKVVVIGAAALNCQLPTTGRRTYDIDLTILAEVDAVSAHMRKLGCARDPKREHRWLAPDGLAIDVLPVTAEAIARSELVWPESGFVMNLRGFDLLLHHTRKVSLDANHSIDVATLPTIVVLKMASWLDNPSERSRDLQDIGFVLSEYLPLDDERRWDDPQLQGIDVEGQSARALGIDIASIARPRHLELVHTFLERLADTGSQAFALMAASGGLPGGYRDALLQERLAALRAAFSDG